MKLLLLFLTFTLPLLGKTRLSLSDQIIEPSTKIELIFDKAMVTPDQVGTTVENTFLSIEPTWITKITWRSQNIATLDRLRPAKIGTTYQFALSKPLTAVDGTIVPAQKFKAVTSESLRVVRSRRVGSIRTGGQLLIFNDDVNPSSAAPFFQFVSPETEEQKSQVIAARTRKATWGDLGNRYYYKPSWNERYTGKSIRYTNPAPLDSDVIKHAIVVEPVTPLPIGNQWSLRRLADLPNAAGTASADDINHYTIGNIVPFIAKGIFPLTSPDQPRTCLLYTSPSPRDRG